MMASHSPQFTIVMVTRLAVLAVHQAVGSEARLSVSGVSGAAAMRMRAKQTAWGGRREWTAYSIRLHDRSDDVQMQQVWVLVLVWVLVPAGASAVGAQMLLLVHRRAARQQQQQAMVA